MATRRFKRYKDKQGNNRYDPTDDGIGGLSDRHLKEIEAAGHTVEIVDDRKAGDIFKSSEINDEEAFEFLTEPMPDKTSDLDDRIASLDVKLQAFKAIDDALVKAGVNPGEFTKKIQIGKGKKKRGEKIRTLKRLDTGELKGGVPGPYIKRSPTHETRVHVRRDGDGELRPIDMEPTVFGVLDIDPMTKGGPDMTANEIVGMQAAKLMQEGPVKENKQMGTKTDRYGRQYTAPMTHYADIKQGGENVDLMVVARGGDFDDTMNIPRFTNLIKTSDFDLAGEVKALKRQGFTTEEAVKVLAGSGKLRQINPTSMGKLARADIENVGGDPQAVYDALLVSGIDRKLYADSMAIKQGREPYGRVHPDAELMAEDVLAVAPETLHKVDLHGLRDAIDKKEIKTKIFSNKNRGVRGDDYVRDKLQEIIPQLNNPYIQDLSVTHPYTQQLLRQLPYV